MHTVFLYTVQYIFLRNRVRLVVEVGVGFAPQISIYWYIVTKNVIAHSCLLSSTYYFYFYTLNGYV